MSTTFVPSSDWLVVRLGPVAQKLTDDEFFEFCQLNRHVRIERTSEGEVIVMPPAGGESGSYEFRLGGFFHQWVEKDGQGIAFSSSTGFKLPNGAVRSPDLAWVRRSRWETLTEKQRKTFAPICPDFVAEIRSPSDSIVGLKEKMEEYLANGARLGWLIDPSDRKVYVYRAESEVQCLDNPTSLSGDPVLPGFALRMEQLWGKAAPSAWG
jgi:Uma2 family endonuclease